MQDIQEKFNKAAQLYQAGDFSKAEAVYKQIIEQEPENSNALNSYGIFLYKIKKYDEAIRLIKKAVEIEPSAYFNINLGNVYFAKADYQDAVKAYESALFLEPENFKATFGLALAYKCINELEKSISYYQKAIELNPDFSNSYVNLGNIYKELEQIEKAIGCYKKAYELNNQDLDVCFTLGVMYLHDDQLNEAEKCLTQALKLNPNSYLVNYTLGMVYFRLESFNQAIEYYYKAYTLKPEEVECLFNIGLSLEATLAMDDAIKLYNNMLAADPTNYKVYFNLANIYIWLHEFDKSIECCHKILELNPDNVEVYLTLGTTYKKKKEIDKAIQCYKKAIELDENFTDAYFNLSMAYLLNGEFEKGWELYELRFLASGNNMERVKSSKPEWDGFSLENKTIFIQREQGLGDCIMFSRFIPVLSKMGAKVLFKPHAELEQLFKENDFPAQIISNSTPVESLEFDTHITLMSLARVLNINADNIPFNDKYLKANPEKVKRFKEKYFDNDKFKIGIVWQCKNVYPDDLHRSLPDVKHLFPLAQIPNVKIYSIQKGTGVEQLKNLPEGIEITDLGSNFKDFTDTAAAIENLDLVISVDTSVIHLVGALGKPVWQMLPFSSDWKWLLDIDYSPWYKSMKIFRQTKPCCWDDVINNIVSNLKEKV